MSVEVMKQALEALENHAPIVAGREIEALRAAIQQAESGHARLPGALKDHQIAAMVNSLRDIARQFHGHGSLRERIANVLVPALKAEAKTDEPVGEPLGYIPTDAIEQIKTPPRLITNNVPVLSYAAEGYTAIYTSPAPGVPDGYVLVPISDLEDAEESIDDYRNGLEFGVSDTSILDRLGALITAAQAQKGAADAPN